MAGSLTCSGYRGCWEPGQQLDVLRPSFHTHHLSLLSASQHRSETRCVRNKIEGSCALDSTQEVTCIQWIQFEYDSCIQTQTQTLECIQTHSNSWITSNSWIQEVKCNHGRFIFLNKTFNTIASLNKTWIQLLTTLGRYAWWLSHLKRKNSSCEPPSCRAHKGRRHLGLDRTPMLGGLDKGNSAVSMSESNGMTACLSLSDESRIYLIYFSNTTPGVTPRGVILHLCT